MITVKEVADSLTLDEEFVRIFVEAHQLRKITITNIVRVSSANQVALFLEVVREFLAGFRPSGKSLANTSIYKENKVRIRRFYYSESKNKHQHDNQSHHISPGIWLESFGIRHLIVSHNNSKLNHEDLSLYVFNWLYRISDNNSKLAAVKSNNFFYKKPLLGQSLFEIRMQVEEK
ncbi:hypothetical protein YC2023_060826 [Brassica napus]